MFESMASIVEMGFVYSVALGFGIWQLISTRRLIKRDKERADVVSDADQKLP